MKISRWLKSTGKWVSILLIVLISLYALAYAWISWSAKREWVQTKEELEARGEKLSLVDFIPPPIADEENFFMAPLFADMVKSPDRPKDGYRWEAMMIKGVDGNPITSAVSLKDAREGLIDLNTYAALLRTDANRNQSAAEVLLNAFEPNRELWDELKGAAKKPNARFPIQYEKLNDARLPHLSANSYIRLPQLLRIHALASIEAGKPKDAERDILLIIRIADTLSAEPLEISQMVRGSSFSIATFGIIDGIQRHAWTVEQLKVFEARLRLENPLEALIFGIRAERACSNTFFDQVRRNQKLLFDLSRQVFAPPIPWRFRFLLTLFPRDLVYSSMALSNQVMQKQVDALFAIENSRFGKEPIAKFDDIVYDVYGENFSTEFKQWKYWPIHALPLAVNTSMFRAAVNVDMTRIACALERYKIAQGAYPANLKMLVPDYIEKLPNDIASGKPYHYSRNASGNFTLWSVGYDGVDDNATSVTKANRKKGDWVWGVPTR